MPVTKKLQEELKISQRRLKKVHKFKVTMKNE